MRALRLLLLAFALLWNFAPAASAQFFTPPPPQQRAPSGGGTTTWDPANNYTMLSNGNLTSAYSSGAGPGTRSISSHASGKYVFAIFQGATGGTYTGYGVLSASANLSDLTNSPYLSANFGGGIYCNAIQVGYAPSYTNSQWTFVAADLTNKLIWYSTDGTTWGTSTGVTGGNPGAGTGGSSICFSGPYYIASAHTSSDAPITIDSAGTAGGGFTPPSGFSWWN